MGKNVTPILAVLSALILVSVFGLFTLYVMYKQVNQENDHNQHLLEEVKNALNTMSLEASDAQLYPLGNRVMQLGAALHEKEGRLEYIHTFIREFSDDLSQHQYSSEELAVRLQHFQHQVDSMMQLGSESLADRQSQALEAATAQAEEAQQEAEDITAITSVYPTAPTVSVNANALQESRGGSSSRSPRYSNRVLQEFSSQTDQGRSLRTSLVSLSPKDLMHQDRTDYLAVAQQFYHQQQDYSNAAFYYHKAAEQGHAEAQFNLAWMLDHGQGVAEDDNKAVYWYKKSADQAYAPAQNNLGWMFSHGSGIPHDYRFAVACFEKAAAQGLGEAQYNMALMYKNGKGVMRSYPIALTWYKKAAKQGNKKAIAYLDKYTF